MIEFNDVNNLYIKDMSEIIGMKLGRIYNN